MAKVEIYKFKKTVDPAVREYGLFEFFGMGGPFPQNYVREWAGELNSGDLATILGRSVINPPDGYKGGPLEKGDIVVVDGTAYFLDRMSGYKFEEINFDASAIKGAIHVEYGRYVSLADAVPIPRPFAAACESLDIPVGYLGEPGYHGSSKGVSDFDTAPDNAQSPCYLHPQFLKGSEAKEFVGLLKELMATDQWEQIADYLRANYPIYMIDLETARGQFAPELLLPAELRPISKVIPSGADKTEVDYLTAKINGMDEEQRSVFYAVVEGGLYVETKGIAEFINIAENLECFELKHLVSDASRYGMLRLEGDYDVCAATIQRLEKSKDPDERFLAKYITLLNRCVDDETYGYHAAKEDGGVFTKYGLIIQERAVEDIYRGVQDIPAEYRVTAPAPVAEAGGNSLVKVCDTDLTALLLEMHALGGDYMRDVKHNLKTLAGGNTDYIVMMNEHILTVTPADTVFRRDMSEHELLMMLSHTPDIRMFVMSVTEREDGRVTGNLCEVALEALQHYIRNNSFHFTHLDAELKDGISRRFSLEEWDAMDRADREQLKSWIKHYDPANESHLITYLDVLRSAVEANRTAVPSAKFLSQISEAYMARSHASQAGRFRVTPEAARDIVAQNAASVFKFYPEPFAQMQPIDAAKPGLWADGKSEFSVMHGDWEKLEKWAKRAAGEILRQTERGEHKKSHDAEL